MPRAAQHVVLTPKQFIAWSISRYLDHSGPDGCPLRAKLRHLDKIDTGPPSAAMARGRRVHIDGDKWLSKKLRSFPAAYGSFKTEMRVLRGQLMAHEAAWAFTDKWQAIGWWDEKTWCRIKCDAVATLSESKAQVIDFKTGTMRDYRVEEYRMQLELYAIAAFTNVPKAKTVTCELWYLDQGIIYGGATDGYVYERSQLPGLKKLWQSRVTPMLRDKTFKPRPGAYCKYCPFAAERGGQCKF